MIAHTQTIFVNDPRGIPGDCMRTAVASLLDMPTEAVPHFVLFEDWFGAFSLWLNGHGLRRVGSWRSGSRSTSVAGWTKRQTVLGARAQ